jgi:type IV pilus assembly protein PilM
VIEDAGELETAIRFQAQDQIPMPLDQAVLDHRVVARETGPEGHRQMDVVAVAARRDMVTSLIDAMRKAGLRPVGIDLSAFGMIRALGDGLGPSSDGELAPTALFCHIGDVTNLAVARNKQCLFTRVAPYGIEDITEGLAGRIGVPVDEAREMMLDVGVEDPLSEFSDVGEAVSATREALLDGCSRLADEIRVSLEFYSALEGASPVQHVVVCGPGGTIPGLPDKIQTALGRPIELMSPPALSHLDDEDAARLTVAYGLALEA